MDLSRILLKQVPEKKFSSMHDFWYSKSKYSKNLNTLQILTPIYFQDYELLLKEFLKQNQGDRISIKKNKEWEKYYKRKMGNKEIKEIIKMKPIKKEIMRKILPYALAFGMSIAPHIGTISDANAGSKKAEKEYATFQEAQNILRIKNPRFIKYLPNGYKTSGPIKGLLRLLAGIDAGTVNIQETKDGYTAEGSYSQFLHPESMKRIIKEADTLNDKVITQKEAENLRYKMLREKGINY